jgi:imidazolonepropionase-like amidohydrolase
MEIHVGTLIDGTGAPARRNVVIKIDGERIAEIRDAARSASGNLDIDARRLSALPGLLNCHEHLSFKARRGSIAEMMAVPDATLALQAAESARWDISQGITTVRSTGDKNFIDVAMARATASGMALGPRVIAAGPPLLMSGGHGYPLGWEVDGADGFRAAARKLLKNGSDFVKLISSGGLAKTRPGEGTMHLELTVDEMRAAVDVAHLAERRVAAHAHGPEAIERALEAGVDSIEHGTLLTSELTQRMVAQGTYLVPTLSQIHRFAYRGVELGKPKSYQDSALEIWDETFERFSAAVKQGIKFVAGTDGVGDLKEEIEHFVRAGATPVQAIHAATGRAAELLGLPVGVLANGRLADVVIVEGDPSEDVSALRQVVTVIQGGRLVWSRPPLD